MTCRTGNVIVSFMELDDDPIPMFTDFNVSTQGYRSPDSPYRYAPAWLKPNISIDKSIGAVFWKESSGVEFGNIDIAIENGGLVQVSSSMIDWIAWAQSNPNPQVVISLELSDGTLEHIATADGRDVLFPDDRTIRVTLETKHGMKLDQFINLYYEGISDSIDGQVRPIYWGAGGLGFGAFKVMPTVFLDETTLRFDVTDLDIIQGLSPSPYFVRDRGVILEEGMSPGFTIVDTGFELSANPDGKITWNWVSAEGAGVLDPLESDERLIGAWRICRLFLDRVEIDWPTYFPAESAFSDIQVIGREAWPTVNYQSEITASSALTDIMDDVGGWWYVDELGNFQFGLLQAPESLSSVATYTDKDSVGDIAVQVDRAPGLSDRLDYNWRPGFYQADQLAGSVASSGGIVREWSAVETQEPIPEIYETARGHEPMEFASAGFRPAAQSELDRRWSDLYDRTRRFYNFSVPIRGNTVIPNLGQAVQVSSERFRMLQQGIAMYVRRVKLDLGRGLMTIQGWGGNPVSTPLAPTNLVIVGDGLEWQDNAFNETGYRVEESADGVTGWSTTTTLPANSTSYAGPLDDGLFYRVIAVNGAGDSTPSNVVEFSPSSLFTGLVSWWAMEESGLNDRLDSHGSNDFEAVGAATISAVAGVIGNAVHFGPAGSGRALDQPADGTGMDGDTTFSVAGWVNFDTAVGQQFFFERWVTNAAGFDWWLGLDTSARFVLKRGNGGGSAVQEIEATSFGAPTTGTDYFVYAYFDFEGGEMGISINDGTVDSVTLGGGIPDVAGRTMRMGQFEDNFGRHFFGFMDEWAYWSRILTPAEVTELYNGGSGITYTDL